MPRAASIRSGTSASISRVEGLAYDDILDQNGVKFVYKLIPADDNWFNHGNEGSWQALELLRTSVMILHSRYSEIIGTQPGMPLSESGIQDDQLVLRATRLVETIHTMRANQEESGWQRLLEIEFFNHYDYFSRFSFSKNDQWSYDPWPESKARQQLTNPKPNFAFGVKLAGNAQLRMARLVPELTYPHVSPFCIPSAPREILFPFFIVESKSLLGDAMSCTSQLANSIIKALDLIAGLELQHKLFVIGLCQFGFFYECYLAYSTDDQPEVDIPRKYSINLLTSGDLRALGDMIGLLRLLEAARAYGQETFSHDVLAALQVLVGDRIPDSVLS